MQSLQADFSARVSYLEIYNEELGDLLGDDEEKKSKKLMLCDRFLNLCKKGWGS